MRSVFYIFLLAVVFNMACVEDFNLDVDDDDLKIVVDGLITDEPGPYFVRLIYSSDVVRQYPEDWQYDKEQPVMNALVIISDDYGQIDTLKPIDINPEDYNYDHVLGNYAVVYDSIKQQYDTVVLTHPIEYRHDRGFYKTNSIIGIPNRRYKLSVVYKGLEYIAFDYMMEVPSIDSVNFIKESKEAVDLEYYIPTVYFKEPQNQNNNYLFHLSEGLDDRFQISNRVWPYSILSDKTLEPYVNGLQIDDGDSPDGVVIYRTNIGDSLTVRMSSLSLEAFKYFESLIEQFEYDGGAYKPSPASPPTNLSNGALGFFRASAVTNYKERVLIN